MKVRNMCLSTRICTSDIINPPLRSFKGGLCFRGFKRVESGLRRVEPKTNGASRAVPMLGDDQVVGPGCLALRIVEVIAVDEEHDVRFVLYRTALP